MVLFYISRDESFFFNKENYDQDLLSLIFSLLKKTFCYKDSIDKVSQKMIHPDDPDIINSSFRYNKWLTMNLSVPILSSIFYYLKSLNFQLNTKVDKYLNRLGYGKYRKENK